MQARSLLHLSDEALLHTLESLSGRRRRTTAELLLHLAEVDRRKLHLRHAYTSLTRYCIGALHMSTDSAFKHARAARMSRRHPGILAAVAEGRLHLSAIVMLLPYLERGPAAELLQAAEHKTKSQLALLLAEHFPNPDVPTSLRESLAAPAMPGLALEVADAATSQLAPGPVCMTTPQHQRVAPLSPGRYELRLTLGQTAHDKLCRAKELLGHAVPSGDLSEVIERALEVLVEQLEKRVCAATRAPRTGATEGGTDGRYIPAEVRRAVWKRDEGRCTFESPSGVRCDSRTAVQIDHVVPFALGGRTSVENLRLLCRAHNHYEAERVFGERFIEGKCEQGDAQATRARLEHEARTSSAPGHANAQSRGHVDEVIPYLLALKIPRPEARRGAELCAEMRDTSLEQRVKVALQGLGRARFRRCTHAPTAPGPSSAPG